LEGSVVSIVVEVFNEVEILREDFESVGFFDFRTVDLTVLKLEVSEGLSVFVSV
jgi:hypothetical protein